VEVLYLQPESEKESQPPVDVDKPLGQPGEGGIMALEDRIGQVRPGRSATQMGFHVVISPHDHSFFVVYPTYAREKYQRFRYLGDGDFQASG
jgi:hypothetical protein